MAQTSLARQLQKLATPQTSLLKETKTRVSFLFDPREAAALDTDTAYAIGNTTGLEELSTLNEAFSHFEENLFSESAKFLERAVKSREENTILDGQIEQFLLLLSPHFLLRPAHKALEWLVYRFHVHEYNVDALLRCILPFHETRVFARALQLLDLSSKTSKWHWLHCPSCTAGSEEHWKPGLSLTKTALVTQCARDPGALKFVCELLVAMTKVHSENTVALRPAIGLYASTVLGTLEAMKKITDQTVAMLLPYILKGLASSAIPDHRAATYLVVGQLARRTVLSREILRVDRPSRQEYEGARQLRCKPVRWPPGLLVLMTLQDIRKCPSAFRVGHPEAILARLIKSVVESPQSENEDGSKTAAAVLKALIQLALSLDKYSDFVVRCPDEVDACLESHLCGDDEQARLAAQQLTRSNAFGREHPWWRPREAHYFWLSTVPASTTEWQPCGNWSLLSRRAAMGPVIKKFRTKHKFGKRMRRSLAENFRKRPATTQNNEDDELAAAVDASADVDEKFARDSLRSRLVDTEPEVVQAVLALGKDLCNFVEQSFVLSTLRRILFEPAEESTKWFDLRTRALAFVCDDLCTVVDEGQLLAALLPFLMPTEKSEMSLARVAYASRALQRFPMFKTVSTDKRMTAALGAEDLDTITELLLANIAETVGKVEQPLALVKTLEELCFPSTGYAAAQLRCICGSLLNGLASSTKNVEVLREALRFYQRLLAEKAACGEYEFAVAAVRDGRVPSTMVISGLTAVINGQDEATHAALDILTDIFEMVAENSSIKSSCRLQFASCYKNSSRCLQQRFQQRFPGAPATHQKERLQSLALAVSIQLLWGAEGIKWILAEKNLVFLSIILSLLSPTQGIRDLAVSLVEASVACSHKGRSGLRALLSWKLLKLVASWNATLKKPNTLLALLNHKQVPVAMRCGILTLVSRIDSKEVLEAAVKLIATTLGLEARDIAATSPLSSAEAQLLRECFAKYGLSAVQRLADVEGAVETFEKALRSTRRCEGDSVANMALQVVTKDLVKKLPKENQAALLDTLVDLALDTPPTVQHSAVLRALRKVCSFGSLLVEPLQRTGTSRQSPAKTVREAKKMRLMDASEEQDPAESPQWKRILILLEMIQSGKSIEDVLLLVAPLYALLKRSLELNQSPHVEYLRQCVLTALQAHGLSAPRHELATLVKCLRHSQSAQAQQLSLGLLNLAAQKYPEEVLHNVTSVFTFMGANLLRLDDNYSFQTVMQTVETVVPALLQACAGESKSAEASESAVASVTHVFVGAFLDIPEHRRLPLLTKLATTLGASDHLWVLAAQMAEHHVTKMAATMDTDESTSNILEFGLSLCGQFEVPVQMQTTTHLLKFAATLPAVKDNSNDPPSHPEVFDLRLYSDKQLQRFRLSIANFVANLLGSSTFLGQMAALQGGKGDAGTTEALCGPCLSACLQFLQQVSRWSQSPTKTPYQERAWKALLSKLHDVVHKVNGLLPSGQFVSVIRSLMCHELSSIRRSAMDMLNEKLAAKDYFAEEDTQSLLELVPMLLQMAHGKSLSNMPSAPSVGDRTSGATSSEEAALNRQTALLSLKLLIRTLGAEHRDAFAEVYDLAHQLLSDKRLNPLLMSSALLCFAELCHSLPTPTIAHFGRLMPPFLNILQEQGKERSDVVTMALITALHRLVESLAPFLSAYLTTILVQVCTMHVSCAKEAASGTLGQRLESTSTHIAHHVPARVLIPAIEESFHKLSHSAAALEPLMSLLGEFISSMEKADLKGHLPQLQELVLQLLAYRRDNSQVEDAEVDTVETSIVGVVTSLSFKLSEVTFRPFFYKIYNWAAVEDPDKNKVLTFYHLTERLSEMLKSLFVLFAGVFVEHSADLLVATNTAKTEEDYFDDEAKSCLLLNHVLATLTACFHHGGKQFLTREKAAFLLKPLVNQVENELGGEEATQKRVERHLVPCLASFAAGCEDATRKEWHQKLLYQMRNSKAQVRYTTLLAFREAVRKLGDDYLSFLPEAVPFLAELMEDESTEVESLCQDVILEVEQILGEPLMKYF
ncbi:HEAT repeat-containing protein 1-like [Rhipicephalus sanguineus]|uniref:HEAT repeat-containing protein 1-like n=1 Tax=Rhipicephalus sanguineus TaxID=34632 RepID=UPI0020C292D5|nr:HEAT repeat-containing protein 1-like [Rhipicephalus sanguineus]